MINKNINPEVTSPTLFGNQAEHRQKGGREYLVVPGIPVQEQVMNSYLLPAEEIQSYINIWNGTPVSIGHARANGGSVKVPEPDVPIIGSLFNVEWDSENKRMLAEYWIDIEEAMRHNDGKLILDNIHNGKMLETSTAYWADEKFVAGNHNGKDYKSIHSNTRPDHVAIFADQTPGACSIEDGCGVNRNMKQNGECGCVIHNNTGNLPAAGKAIWERVYEENKDKGEERAAKIAWGAVKRAGYVQEDDKWVKHNESLDKRLEQIRAAFERYSQNTVAAYPSPSYCYIREIFDGYVIAEKSGGMYRVNYSYSDGNIVFDDPENWKKVTQEYVFSNNALPPFQKGHLPTVMLVRFAFDTGYRTPEQLDKTNTYVERNGISKPVWLQCFENGDYKILDGAHRILLADEYDYEQVPVNAVDELLQPVDVETIYYKWEHDMDRSYLNASLRMDKGKSKKKKRKFVYKGKTYQFSDVVWQFGGPGSGHHGHKGRPGSEGGSAKGKGSGASSDNDEVHNTLENPKSLPELKSTLAGLGGKGDLRESVGRTLESAGYKYEASFQGAGSGQTDMYVRGKVEVLVDYKGDKTKVSMKVNR